VNAYLPRGEPVVRANDHSSVGARVVLEEAHDAVDGRKALVQVRRDALGGLAGMELVGRVHVTQICVLQPVRRLEHGEDDIARRLFEQTLQHAMTLVQRGDGAAAQCLVAPVGLPARLHLDDVVGGPRENLAL
jgi:hypothetical protein